MHAQTLILLFGLLACGRLDVHHPKTATPDNRIDELVAAKAQLQSKYEEATTSRKGWPSTTDCDAMVFAGEACGAGVDVAISLAEYSPGAIHRRPPPACWIMGAKDPQPSATTVSRDDLVSYMTCAWRRQDKAALERLAAYGEKHAWVMGSPSTVETSDRVIFGPNLTGLLGRMLYALSSGADARAYRLLMEVPLPGVQDYQQHIEALEVTLMGRVNADLRLRGLDPGPAAPPGLGLDVNSWELGLFTALATQHPDNPLFQGALGVYTGDQSKAIALLLDPATPVPTYVRGDQVDLFAMAHWLFAADIVLKHFGR